MGPLLKTRLFLARWLLLAGFTALLFAARPAMAVGLLDVYVDDDYTAINGAGGHTWGVDAFATIEDGVNAVASGGTVHVAAGTYAPTSLTLNKAVTLNGAKAGVDGRTGDPSTPSTGRGGLVNESVITSGGSHTFDLAAGAADHITFDGFFFQNFASRTIDAYYYANYFTMKNCILAGSIEGTSSPVYETGAIQFNGDFTRVDADFFTFERNLVITDDGHLFDFNRAMNNGIIRNNKFKCDSVAFGPFTYTILSVTYYSNDWLIQGNEFDGVVAGHGLLRWGWGFNSDFANSKITGNNVHQMWLGLGQLSLNGGEIVDNDFIDNDLWAFMLWGDQYSSQSIAATQVSKNVVIQNNRIHYNGKSYSAAVDASHGIVLREGIDASLVQIRYNTFKDLNSGGTPAGTAWAVKHLAAPTVVHLDRNYWEPAVPMTIAAQVGEGQAGQGTFTYANPLSSQPTTVAITTTTPPAGDLQSILDGLNPGDLVTIANGTYSFGALTVTVSGGVITVSGANLNMRGASVLQDVVVNAGAGISGNALLQKLTLLGNIGPGVSPGLIAVAGDVEWGVGGSYDWEINDATGAAGTDPGWDLISATGLLNITATAGSKFTVNVKTLAGNTSGNPANFNGTVPLDWTIATAGGGVSGFNTGSFTVNSSAVPAFTDGGTVYKFTLNQSGNDVRVHFEPNVAPVVNGASPLVNQSATYGNTFSYTFPANAFTDADITANWPQTLTYTAFGMPDGVTLAGRTFSGDGTTPVNPGPYTVTVRATDNGVPVRFVESTFVITINTRAVTVTANDQNKTYGTTLTLGAGSTLFSTSVGGLANGDTIGTVTITATSAPLNGTQPTDPVADYVLTPSGATGGTFTPSNYNISYANGTLHVTKAVLTVTAGDRRKQQGTMNATSYPPPPDTYTITGFVNSENATSAGVSGTPTINSTAAEGTGTAAGAYPITVDVTGMSAANYSFVGASGTFDVMTVLAVPFDMVIGDRGTSVEKGTITLLSGANNPSPNTQYVISTAIKSPYEIDVDANRNYVVVDNADYGKTFNTFGVWRIEKNTLARTLISRGGSLVSPMGVKVLTNGPLAHVGKYIVLDSDAFNDGANQWGAIIRIDPTLAWPGNQTVLSSRFVGSGDMFYWPLGTAMALDGNSVYITDQGEPADHAFKPARIFQVDLATGARTVLFTATVTAGVTTNMCQPVGLAIESDGSSLVIADAEGKRLLRFTFAGSVLSTVSSTNGAFNAPFIFPTHVAIRRDTGNYIVTDAPRAGDGLTVGGRHVFEINKTSGAATTLTTDGFLEEPRGVVIIP